METPLAAADAPYPFLRGGGEMGERIRRFDWSETTLGTPDQWPQSLRTSVSILLFSSFPMVLWWGPELIQFYNDAFRLSLDTDGGHSASLGQPAIEHWTENWHIIKPLIDRVIEQGEPVFGGDELLPNYRNSRIGEAYWTFSYSPVPDESGRPAAVFITGFESTPKVHSPAAAQEKSDRLEFAIEAAELGTWNLNPATGRFTANARLKDWFGLRPDEEITLSLALDAIVAEDRQQVVDAISQAQQYASGGHYDTEYTIIHPATGQRRMVRAKGRAWFGDDKQVYCFNGILQDITAERNAQQGRIAAQKLADLAIKSSGIGLFNINLADGQMDYTPESATILTGSADTKGLTRKAFLERLHPDDEPLRAAAEKTAMATGEFNYEPRVVWDDNSVHRIRVMGAAVRNEAGEPIFLSGTVQDVTAQETALKTIEESELRYRSLVENTPDVITCWDTNLRLIYANSAFEQITGQPLGGMLGKTNLEMGQSPEVARPYMAALNRALTTGRLIKHHNEFPIRGGMAAFHLKLIPVTGTDGTVQSVLSIAHDITEIKTSEARFRSLIEEAPVATCLFTGRNLIIEVANDMMLGFWGKDRSVIGHPLAEAMPILKGQPFLDILDSVFTTGHTYEAKNARAELEAGGINGTYYFDFTYKPLRNAAGEVYGIMNMAIDVTEQVAARQQLEKAESTLRDAVELAGLATWGIDMVTGTITYSQRLKDWLGIESVMVSDDEATERIHPNDRERIRLAIFAALAPGSTGRYDEIYTIIHSQTGRERIIHAIGKTVFSEQGMPLSISGTVQDITMQQQQQLALEAEVQQRTSELAAVVAELQATNEELAELNDRLQHSNDELAQYAYVASHDLQEPLRKIRIFSGLLSNHPGMPEAAKGIMEKITGSASRMSLLIKDLLEFSRLLKTDALMLPVSLDEVLAAVISDFELTITEKGAVIEAGELPVIEAVALQMNQLFFNLLSNALKFTKPDTVPRIRIAAASIGQEEAGQHLKKLLPFAQYHHITFTDNGIGFDTQYAEQIFEVFKRLHGRDHYPGSGIGLSLCRRIAGNHNGALYAESQPRVGTTFHLILPGRQYDDASTMSEGLSLI